MARVWPIEFLCAGLVVTFRPGRREDALLGKPAAPGEAVVRCEDTGEEFLRVDGVKDLQHAMQVLKTRLIAERPDVWGGRAAERARQQHARKMAQFHRDDAVHG